MEDGHSEFAKVTPDPVPALVVSNRVSFSLHALNAAVVAKIRNRPIEHNEKVHGPDSRMLNIAPPTPSTNEHLSFGKAVHLTSKQAHEARNTERAGA